MALTASNIATWSIAVPREALKGRSCIWATISSDFVFQSMMTSARVGAGTNAATMTPASSNLQHQFFQIKFMVEPSSYSAEVGLFRCGISIQADSVRVRTEENPAEGAHALFIPQRPGLTFR